MSTTRMFFGLLLTMLGLFAVGQNINAGLRPEHWALWDIFGIASLLALGLALLLGRKAPR